MGTAPRLIAEGGYLVPGAAPAGTTPWTYPLVEKPAADDGATPLRGLGAAYPGESPMTAVATPTADSSVDQAVARLAEEFADRVRPQSIVRVVKDCRRELGGSPVGALPELVERLARYRLGQSIG